MDVQSADNTQVTRTPVALLIFNRPQHTQRVFEEIRRAKPAQLFVIADGPRDEPEHAKCEQARAIIHQVDWPCELSVNVSQANLGCKKRVASGIDWVFDQVDEAIILEDDCLPHPTFFRFCDEMLERYRSDERIMHVGGSNAQFGERPTADSYYFSAINMIWGWATWKRAWKKHYDVTMNRWEQIRETFMLEYLLGEKVASRFRVSFDNVHTGKTDTWDNQWTLSMWLAGGLAILPAVNLISNIGFGADATHTRKANSAVANLAVEAMEFPLRHPHCIGRNREADDNAFRKLIESKAM